MEIERGNAPQSILRNNERDIVLLALLERPKSEISNELVKIHRKHSYGNYCYDGTYATYEDLETGCFLAFRDPEYEDESF